MKQVSARITETARITPWANLIWLEAPEIASEAKPGQFVMVRCGEATLLCRPLSIHQVDEDKKGIALLFAVPNEGTIVEGKGTAWLKQRNVGESLEITGPLGQGFALHPDSKRIMLASGRIGIAPLFFLAQEALKRGISVVTLHGLSSATLQPYPPELWPSPDNFIIATEDGTVGHKGKVTDLLPDYTDWADQVFACGPLPMYKTMAQMPAIKSKPVQISLEMRMGCGVGVCYGCTVRTKSGLKQVCTDGPVFDLQEIYWNELPRI